MPSAVASLSALARLPSGAAVAEGDDQRDDGTSGVVTRRTSLPKHVEEELEKSSPGVLDWLRSSAGMMFQAVLLSAYIVLEVLRALIVSYVLKPPPALPGQPKPLKPLPSSMVFMNSGLSIIIGFLITAAVTMKQEGRIFGTIPKTARIVFSPKNVLAFAPVAAMFSIASVFAMLSYSKLDAGMKKILDQLRLPVTAAASYAITGKKYTMLEWLVLIVILLSIICFYLANVQHDEVTELHTKCHYPPQCFNDDPSWHEQGKICAMRVDGPTIIGTLVSDHRGSNGTVHDITTFPVKDAAEVDFTGLVFSFLSTVFNCIGSLLAEKIMKQTDTAFPAQKAQMETSGCPVALVMALLVPLIIDGGFSGSAVWWSKNDSPNSGLGFFQGYSWKTGMAISIDIVVAWMGGIIVKHFSTVVKVIAKSFVLLLIVFISGAIWKPCQADSLPMSMWNLAFILTFAVILFVQMPKPKQAQSPTLVAPIVSAPAPAANGRTPLVEGQLQMSNQVGAV